MIQNCDSKSGLDEFNLKTVVLDETLFRKHHKELVELTSSQYYQKDPSSTGLSLEETVQYFDDEYKDLFATDTTMVVTFLYLDKTTDELLGTFMFRDAYLNNEKYKIELKTMNAEAQLFDYFSKITQASESIFKKYDIKEKQCIYGTNLAMNPNLMKRVRSKGLKLIFTIFLDALDWACQNNWPFGIWTQFKESLIVSTQLVFTVKEALDFEFKAADFKTDVKGKLFLAMAGDKKQIEESRIKVETGKNF